MEEKQTIITDKKVKPPVDPNKYKDPV